MLSVVNPDAAGIDIGAEELYVAVPEGRAELEIRRFGTYTEDLHEMAQWLKACKVTTVAMESTGVYWMPVHAILEAYEIEVQLVNARHMKNVPGRKSDVKDSQWLRDLHMVGLLRGSFLPKEATAVLRSYLRHRESQVSQRAVHVNHMQKALIRMNARLDEVLSDVTGKTGLEIMRAIAAGEQRPQELLKLRNKRCLGTPEQFVKALTAHYRPEHVFALKQSLAMYDAYTEQIRQVDKEVAAYVKTIIAAEDDQSDPPLGPTRKNNTHSKNAPDYDARALMFKMTGGVDLTDIDGIHEITAQVILSEIGTDMSPWPSAKHFCSWLGLAPKNDITGGKVKRSRTLPGNRRANQAFRMAAQSLFRAKNGLGVYARRMRSKSGPGQAIVATAHKLARIVYCMLKDKKPYVAVSEMDYVKADLERELKYLERRAARAGRKLVSL